MRTNQQLPERAAIPMNTQICLTAIQEAASERSSPVPLSNEKRKSSTTCSPYGTLALKTCNSKNDECYDIPQQPDIDMSTAITAHSTGPKDDEDSGTIKSCDVKVHLEEICCPKIDNSE